MACVTQGSCPEPLCVWKITPAQRTGFGWCSWVLMGDAEKDGLTRGCVAQAALRISGGPFFAGTIFVLPFRKSLDELSIQWNSIQSSKGVK